jgi:hypothetical protein
MQKKDLTVHGIAQVIGYYSAYEIDLPRPVLIVMNAFKFQLVFFPFMDADTNVVNAVMVEPISLWIEDMPHKRAWTHNWLLAQCFAAGQRPIHSKFCGKTYQKENTATLLSRNSKSTTWECCMT